MQDRMLMTYYCTFTWQGVMTLLSRHRTSAVFVVWIILFEADVADDKIALNRD